MADSGFADKSKRQMLDKENHSPNKKVRKSLASSWMRGGGGGGEGGAGSSSTAGNVSVGGGGGMGLDESLPACETPSKSLLGTSDASMLFSPPQILKEMKDMPGADDSGAPGMMDSYTGGANAAASESGGVTPANTAAASSSSSGNGGSPPKSKASRHLLSAFQHELIETDDIL